MGVRHGEIGTRERIPQNVKSKFSQEYINYYCDTLYRIQGPRQFDHGPLGWPLIERPPSRVELPNLLSQTPTPFQKSRKIIELVSLSSPLVLVGVGRIRRAGTDPAAVNVGRSGAIESEPACDGFFQSRRFRRLSV